MEFTSHVFQVIQVPRPNGQRAIQVTLTAPSPPLEKATSKAPVAARIQISASGAPTLQTGEEIRVVLNLSIDEWTALKTKFVVGEEWKVSVDGTKIGLKPRRL